MGDLQQKVANQQAVIDMQQQAIHNLNVAQDKQIEINQHNLETLESVK